MVVAFQPDVDQERGVNTQLITILVALWLEFANIAHKSFNKQLDSNS